MALLAAALYANALAGPFVYDDVVEIRDNPRVHALSSVPSLFVTDFWGTGAGHNPLYRPLTASVTAAVYALGGGHPLPFHALNILLHAAASALALLLLLRLTGSRAAAVAGALIFAAHPVHTEAVAWISGTAEILSAVFVMAAWLGHERARPAVAAPLFALGLLSKEGAIMFPALAAAGDLLSDRPLRSRLKTYAVYAGVAGAYLLVRLAVLGHVVGSGVEGSPLLNPLRGAPAIDRILTSFSVTGRAVAQSIFPRRLCLDYGYDQIPVARGILDGGVLFGALMVAIVIAAAVAGMRAAARSRGGVGRGAGLGAAIFLIAFLPTSNLFFPGISIFAERNLYLPVLGVCLAAASILSGSGGGSRTPVSLASASWLPARRKQIVGAGLTALVVLAAGARTLARNAEFNDPLDLYGAAVESCPRSARAHSFLGIALREAGRPAEASAAQRSALAIAPDYSDAHAELGLSLEMTGDLSAAERELGEALRLKPEDREARANLASVYAETGRRDDALRELSDLVRRFPDDPELLNNYAAVLIERGDAAGLEEARRVYLRLKEEAPGSPFGPNGLGSLYARTGRMDSAAEEFEEALRRSPEDRNAAFNLAQALAASGRRSRALEVVDRALASGVRDEGLERLRDLLRAPGAK